MSVDGVVWVDVFSGVSGDMLFVVLYDVGVLV